MLNTESVLYDYRVKLPNGQFVYKNRRWYAVESAKSAIKKGMSDVGIEQRNAAGEWEPDATAMDQLVERMSKAASNGTTPLQTTAVISVRKHLANLSAATAALSGKREISDEHKVAFLQTVAHALIALEIDPADLDEVINQVLSAE